MRKTARRRGAEVLVWLTLAVAGCGRTVIDWGADSGAGGDGGAAGSFAGGNAGTTGNAGASGNAGESANGGTSGNAGTGGAKSTGGAVGTGGASIGGTGGSGTGGAGAAGGASGSGGSMQTTPKPFGALCQASSECASAFCVDGVCCNNACTGPCRSCALAASLGICVPAAAGTLDPRAICTAEATTTCGRSGRCDGAGACQRYPTGTLCAVSTCVADVWTPSAACDAQGSCRTPPGVSCAPYGCNVSAGRCNSGCPAGDSICLEGFYCAGDESCFPRKDPGVACGSNHECKSGFCVGGACCGAGCS